MTIASLDTLTWNTTQLGEAIETLARQANLMPRLSQAPVFPANLARADDETLARWVDVVANHLSIEAEPIESSFADIDALLKDAPPAILEITRGVDPTKPKNGHDPDERRFLVLANRRGWRVTAIAPDLSKNTISTKIIRDAACAPVVAPYLSATEDILSRAGVPEDRRESVRSMFLAQLLGSTRVVRGWMLRHLPSASYVQQAQSLGMFPLVAVVIGTVLLQQGLLVGTWAIIGRGVFTGTFESFWMWAWALLLLTGIPLQMLTIVAGTRLGTFAGSIFRNTMLYGALKLRPEEIRHQGVGQFLNRVMSADTVEYSSMTGALTMILSISQLITAFGALLLSDGGWVSAAVLGVIVAITLLLAWLYWRSVDAWVDTFRQMTNDLVERMVGHRTRLAQEDPSAWHVEEDQQLADYFQLSERQARIANLLAGIPRAWMMAGLTSTVGVFIVQSATVPQLAIGLGGVLLAEQSLTAGVSQLQLFAQLTKSWRQIAPLFQSARRPVEKSLPALFANGNSNGGNESANGHTSKSMAQRTNGDPLLAMRDVSFRYRERGRLALNDIALEIHAGDRLLLEGPSGGGKSTLAAVLAGLRLPESGLLLLRGYDRASVGMDAWRKRVVVAPQFHENHVFSETFAFNLLMGRRWPPLPEDEREALEICGELGLSDLIARMPSGLQQMVGESGWQLSHGERSRMYIARALLQRADFIILDESFAALDPENLSRALKTVLKRAPTLLVIAHP